jgi:hypothetical protein
VRACTSFAIRSGQCWVARVFNEEAESPSSSSLPRLGNSRVTLECQRWLRLIE